MRIRSMYDFETMPKPPWVVPGWFRERSLTMISAPGGSGKSNLATALALHAAVGRGFLGEAAGTPRRVLYVANDAAEWDHAHVSRRIMRGMGCTPMDFEPDDAAWTGGILFNTDTFQLQDGQFEEIMSQVAWPGPTPDAPPGAVDMVVLDSFRNIHDADENQSGPMMRIMTFLRRWADQNCAVVLLHHSKKPGEFTSRGGWDSARGSGVIHNSVDAHIVVLPSTRKNPEPGAVVQKLVWVKGRGGDKTSSFRYRMAWDENAMTFERVRRGRAPGAPARQPRRVPWAG